MSLPSLYQHYTGLPKERVIGTGTLLDTARMKRSVGVRFGVDPRSVGYNLGEHGNSQFGLEPSTDKGQPISIFASVEELDMKLL